uniref:C2H2-type domain-containing protein n=1 Tax=Clastoptera arizonana TaxID=38151 RepID=A0A1B6E200_9HEMI
MSSESSVESVMEEQECEDNFIIETKTIKKFKCMYCNKKYRQNAGRYNHMKRVHGLIVMERVAVSCQELGCKYVCGSKEKLQKHLQKVHNKEMTVLTLEFNSISEFDSWKDEFEKREKCRFVKKSGSRMTEDGFKLCYYYCSRSGTFISHSRGLKKKSSKGTSKSSVHCTASITVTEAQNGMVQVKVCATHYGHSVDLRHLRLTKYDKSNIADQIARGVPREIVLDKIRASAGSDIDRIHLVTMKDIKNIEKAFGVQSSELKRVQHSGMKNLDSWVSGMKSFENDSMIVFYKNDLISSSGGYSAGGDVCLILMTTGQYEIFKKFCNDGIFYLPVLTIKNNFNMNLFTLMVVDDVNEVIPVTFMISNRKDEDVVKFFFQKIKYKLGSFVSKALITDNEEILHTAWCTVFNEETQHFWSTRYVDSNWREMLLSVKNEELQCSIYETLYSFLEQKK